MATIKSLDSAEQAPSTVKETYKYYQKLPRNELCQDSHLIDLRSMHNWPTEARVKVAGTLSFARVVRACENLSPPTHRQEVYPVFEKPDLTIYGIEGFPGRPSTTVAVQTRLIFQRIAGATRSSSCTCSERPPIEPTTPRPVQSTSFDKCSSASQIAL